MYTYILTELLLNLIEKKVSQIISLLFFLIKWLIIKTISIANIWKPNLKLWLPSKENLAHEEIKTEH